MLVHQHSLLQVALCQRRMPLAEQARPLSELFQRQL
jgi:hypothetical protein